MRKEWAKRIVAVCLAGMIIFNVVRPVRAEVLTAAAVGIIVGCMVSAGMSYTSMEAAENSAKYAYSQDPDFWNLVIRQGTQLQATKGFALTYVMWTAATAWVQSKFGITNNNIEVGADGQGTYVGASYGSAISAVDYVINELGLVYDSYFVVYYYGGTSHTGGTTAIWIYSVNKSNAVFDGNVFTTKGSMRRYVFRANHNYEQYWGSYQTHSSGYSITFSDQFVDGSRSYHLLIPLTTVGYDTNVSDIDTSAISYDYSGAEADVLASKINESVTSDDDIISIPLVSASDFVGMKASDMPYAINDTGSAVIPGEDVDDPVVVVPGDVALPGEITIPGEIAIPEELVTPDEIAVPTETVGFLEGIWQAIISLPETLARSIVGTQALDLAKFKLNSEAVATVFPFCIPFDFINSIKSLAVTPRAPVFQMDFSGTILGNYVWKLDMSEYESIAQISRWGIMAGFFVALIINTRRFVSW